MDYRIVRLRVRVGVPQSSSNLAILIVSRSGGQRSVFVATVAFLICN